MGATTATPDRNEIRLWRKPMRQELIEKRLAISPADRLVHNGIVTAILSRTLEAANDRLVGFYWPFKGEFDVRPLVRILHSKGMRFALPMVAEKAQPLAFREWWPGIPMFHGVWNIPFPAQGEPVSPEVLLVPLVGFDKLGYRLGYGGGYYDRTLATFRVKPQTVGIGYEVSKIPTIHPQPHDIAMDLILTEHGLVQTAKIPAHEGCI